jgi:hypothetical protein
MSNVLILSEGAIGDTIAFTVPIAKYLKEKGDTVHGCFTSQNSFRLMKEVPYFDSTFKNDSAADISTSMYDIIYIRDCRNIFNDFSNLDLKKSKIIKYAPDNVASMNRLKSMSNQLEIEDYDIQISINWYKKFYKNFNLSKKTILLNVKSTSTKRCYYSKYELIELFKKNNFNVVEIDVNKNICENLHLIDQAKYIITVDTGVLWLAKALNKKHYLIVPPHSVANRFSAEIILGTKSLNSKTAKDVVEDFLFLIKQHTFI